MKKQLEFGWAVGDVVLEAMNAIVTVAVVIAAVPVLIVWVAIDAVKETRMWTKVHNTLTGDKEEGRKC
jgi:hypothetical protein